VALSNLLLPLTESNRTQRAHHQTQRRPERAGEADDQRTESPKEERGGRGDKTGSSTRERSNDDSTEKPGSDGHERNPPKARRDAQS
jgi:hypothetical protein